MALIGREALFRARSRSETSRYDQPFSLDSVKPASIVTPSSNQDRH